MKVLQVTSVYYHTRLNMLKSRLRGFISEKVIADKYYLVFGKEGLPIGGFGTTKGGWLVGLFSLNRGNGDEIIPMAIKQAKADADKDKDIKIFCTGEFLRKRYAKEGFEVFDVVEWREREAPSTWSKKEFGTPPLYYLRLP